MSSNETDVVDHGVGEPIMGHIAHEKHGFLRVPAMRLGNECWYDHDILLGTVEQINQAERAAQLVGHCHHSVVPLEQLPLEIMNAVTVGRAWPGRRVFYWFDDEDDFYEGADLIEQAIQWWSATEIFKFVKEKNREVGYLDIKPKGRWGSMLGLVPDQDGKQLLALGKLSRPDRTDQQTIGKIAHEIGHALGLSHEHQRRDAQSYVDIVWDNIQRKYLDQYATQVEGLRVGYYDYGSIMQYGAMTPDGKTVKEADGKTDKRDPVTNKVVRRPVMRPRDANAELGQRTHLAMSDVNAATAIYAEAVYRIEVALNPEPPAAAHVFLGIGGRELRLKKQAEKAGHYSLGTNPRAPESEPPLPSSLPPNVANPEKNDPQKPPLSTAHVLGQPMYLRLESRESDNPTWDLKSAEVTIEPHERHKSAWDQDFPHIVYELQKDQADLKLGRDHGLRVYLLRKPPGAVAPDSPGISMIGGEIGCESEPQGHAYLGLAGREFPLLKGTTGFTVSYSATEPKLTEADLQEFPMYIQTDGAADWKLKSGADSLVRVQLDSPDSKIIELVPAASQEPSGSQLHMSATTGTYCSLKYRHAPGEHVYPRAEPHLDEAEKTRQPERVAAYVGKIAVTVCAKAPNDLVYLGLGGREFKLDLAPGPVPEVRHCYIDNPGPRLSLLDLDTYPAYIREAGDVEWLLRSAYVSASLVDNKGAKLYRGRWLNQDTMLSYPTTEKESYLDPQKRTELRQNQEMTVNYASVMNGLALGVESGRRCALVRMRPPLMEVKFVLDTTGSMRGLINAAKQTIRLIIEELRSGRPAPEIRVGLLGYRDKGEEEYLTRRFPLEGGLTADLESVYEHFSDFEAAGGGDIPEAVLPALLEAVADENWTQSPDVYRTVFLVGDAPPHIIGGDTGGDLARLAKDERYKKILSKIAEEDIQINTVQCGTYSPTTPIWKEIAKQGRGTFWQLDDDGTGFHLKVIDTMRKHAAGIGVVYD